MDLPYDFSPVAHLSLCTAQERRDRQFNCRQRECSSYQVAHPKKTIKKFLGSHKDGDSEVVDMTEMPARFQRLRRKSLYEFKRSGPKLGRFAADVNFSELDYVLC